MLAEPAPRVLVATYLLMAVRDAYDRFRLRPGRTFGPDLLGWYDMSGRVAGQEYGVIGPSGAAAQQFPAVLAGFGRRQGAWRRLRRWVRRRSGGSESGQFLFPVGPGTVCVRYRVQWANRVIAALETTVGAAHGLAEAAHQEFLRIVPGHEL